MTSPDTDQSQPTVADLAHLFHSDPEQYSEQDIDQLVSALREKREKFVLKENAPKKTKAKAPVALDPTAITL